MAAKPISIDLQAIWRKYIWPYRSFYLLGGFLILGLIILFGTPLGLYLRDIEQLRQDIQAFGPWGRSFMWRFFFWPVCSVCQALLLCCWPCFYMVAGRGGPDLFCGLVIGLGYFLLGQIVGWKKCTRGQGLAQKICRKGRAAPLLEPHCN